MHRDLFLDSIQKHMKDQCIPRRCSTNLRMKRSNRSYTTPITKTPPLESLMTRLSHQITRNSILTTTKCGQTYLPLLDLRSMKVHSFQMSAATMVQVKNLTSAIVTWIPFTRDQNHNLLELARHSSMLISSRALSVQYPNRESPKLPRPGLLSNCLTSPQLDNGLGRPKLSHFTAGVLASSLATRRWCLHGGHNSGVSTDQCSNSMN